MKNASPSISQFTDVPSFVKNEMTGISMAVQFYYVMFKGKQAKKLLF